MSFSHWDMAIAVFSALAIGLYLGMLLFSLLCMAKRGDEHHREGG